MQYDNNSVIFNKLDQFMNLLWRDRSFLHNFFIPKALIQSHQGHVYNMILYWRLKLFHLYIICLFSMFIFNKK